MTVHDVQLRMQLYDKGVITDEELRACVTNDGVLATHHIETDRNRDDSVVRMQLLMQLHDKTIVTTEEIRQYLGYGPLKKE